MDSDSSLDSELVRASRKGGKKRKAVSDSEYEESDESVSLEEESEWEEEARRRVRSPGRPGPLAGLAVVTVYAQNAVDCGCTAAGPPEPPPSAAARLPPPPPPLAPHCQLWPAPPQC